MVFRNIRKELSVEDLYDNIDSQDDSSCASDKSWNSKKDGSQEDSKNIVYDDDMEQDGENEESAANQSETNWVFAVYQLCCF